MIKIDVKLSSEYGIMFLYDAHIRPEFPKNAGEAGITFTDTCIAFSVLSYVDGDASIVLTDSTEDLELNEEAFSGKLIFPSKVVSLFDHNGRGFAMIHLIDESTKISVRMSENVNARRVECLIDGVDSF